MARIPDVSLDVSNGGRLSSHEFIKGKNPFSALCGITAALCRIGIAALGGKILPNHWFGGED